VLRTLSRSIASITLFCGVSLGGCAHHAHHGKHGSAPSGISVSGRGEAKAAPDMARATVGIEIRAESAEQATAQANERMAQVLAALRSAGVAESDLRTNNFSVTFERDFTPEPPQPVTEPAQPKPNRSATTAVAAPEPKPAQPVVRGSYRASNTVEVVMRDITKVSQVLSAASSSGANNVWGVQFELSDREPLRARARAQAVERAKESAAQLAQLTGVRLGRIRAIEDLAEGGAPPMYMAEMRTAMADASSVPVQQGELTLHHEVRVTYSLDEE
jgi:uncharacterized protein